MHALGHSFYLAHLSSVSVSAVDTDDANHGGHTDQRNQHDPNHRRTAVAEETRHKLLCCGELL